MIEIFKKELLNEDFLKTFDEDENLIDRASLKQIIDNRIGESDYLDFKEELIKEDKIAKLILAMANSGGGIVIFGIADNGEPKGIVPEEIKDITDIQKKVKAYIPFQLQLYWQHIVLRENEMYGKISGKIFILIQVPRQYRYAPFLAEKESNYIKQNIVYVRRNSSITPATNEGLEDIFKLRIIEQYDDMSNIDIEEHIDQLKILYEKIPKSKGPIFNFSEEMQAVIKMNFTTNKYYPSESIDEFISKMIIKKKRKIEIVLEVHNID